MSINVRVISKGFQSFAATFRKVINNVSTYFWGATEKTKDSAVQAEANKSLEQQEIRFTGTLANSIEITDQGSSGRGYFTRYEVTAPYALDLEQGVAPGSITTDDVDFEELLNWVRKKKERGKPGQIQERSVYAIIQSFVNEGREAKPFFDQMVVQIVSSEAVGNEVEDYVISGVLSDVNTFTPTRDPD
jgi:hypothetical protein